MDECLTGFVSGGEGACYGVAEGFDDGRLSASVGADYDCQWEAKGYHLLLIIGAEGTDSAHG